MHACGCRLDKPKSKFAAYTIYIYLYKTHAPTIICNSEMVFRILEGCCSRGDLIWPIYTLGWISGFLWLHCKQSDKDIIRMCITFSVCYRTNTVSKTTVFVLSLQSCQPLSQFISAPTCRNTAPCGGMSTRCDCICASRETGHLPEVSPAWNVTIVKSLKMQLAI